MEKTGNQQMIGIEYFIGWDWSKSYLFLTKLVRCLVIIYVFTKTSNAGYIKKSVIAKDIQKYFWNTIMNGILRKSFLLVTIMRYKTFLYKVQSERLHFKIPIQ